jgi:hypothetical protein
LLDLRGEAKNVVHDEDGLVGVLRTHDIRFEASDLLEGALGGVLRLDGGEGAAS